MPRRLRVAASISALLVLLAGRSAPLTAQAPFNTAVLPAGAVQLQAQSQGHVATSAAGGWVWVLPAAAAGVGHGVELGIGASMIRPRMTGAAPVDLTLAAKWTPIADSARGTAFAIGTFALVPTSGRVVDGVRPDGYAYAYAAASQVLPFTWGTQNPTLSPLVTLAGFTTVGRDGLQRAFLGERRAGLSLGVDQALPASASRAIGLRGTDDQLVLSINWVSGVTAFGYTNAALNVVSGPHAWSFGYARGNRPARNHGPVIGYAFTF